MAARLPALICTHRLSSIGLKPSRYTSHTSSPLSSPCQYRRFHTHDAMHSDSYSRPYRSRRQPVPPKRQRKYPTPEKGTLVRLDKTSLEAWYVRGGTSNGLIIHRKDLPEEESSWGPILSAIMGSPDPSGRQLDGMGSGVSSSNIVVISPSNRGDVDVNYTFVQVDTKDGKLDMEGNCGNLSAAVGPVAWDWGFVRGRRSNEVTEYASNGSTAWANLSMYNTNTQRIITSRFRLAEAKNPKFLPKGNYKIDGVPGTGSTIQLSYKNPGGARTGLTLPTENKWDNLELPDGSTIKATLADVGNPGVFVSKSDLGIAADDVTPEIVEADSNLKERLEHIRQAGAKKMGLDPNVESIPKVVIVWPARDDDSADIRSLSLSMGQAHPTIPLTMALCLGAVCRMPDTVPANMVGHTLKSEGGVIIGHPGGTLDVGTEYERRKLVAAVLRRTARVMMKGTVMY